MTTNTKLFSTLAAVAALAALPAGAHAKTYNHGVDAWECAAGHGKAPGWCQTYSLDTIDLLDASGNVIAGQDCVTGHAPSPDDAFTGYCADWGIHEDGAVPILDDARARGAAQVRRRFVNPEFGDRSLTYTVPALGAASMPVRMTGKGGTQSPRYDITTTMSLSAPEPGVTGKPIPYYSTAEKKALAAKAGKVRKARR